MVVVPALADLDQGMGLRCLVLLLVCAGDPPLYWPERRYPWGVAEAFNKDHSDLLSLRCGVG